MNNYNDITLALAGVFQSAQEVINLAKTGTFDTKVMDPLISSIMKLDADSCEAVYGDKDNLRPGLRLIDSQLRNGASGKSVNLGRYVASILNIERHLSRSSEIQSVIATRVVQIKRKSEITSTFDFELDSEVESESVPKFGNSVIHNIAELYKDTISTLPIRIQVVGDQELLKRSDIQDKVRCCLFAAIRSAVLWRQMGGKRRQLLFNRKQIISTAEDFLLRR